MGLLQDLAASIGDEDLKRLSAGQANFDDPDSLDQQHLQEMVKNFDPEKLQDIFAKVAQKMRPQEYSDHVTPGVGGTNPLGNLTAGALGSIAAVLVSRLKELGASTSTSTRTPVDRLAARRSARSEDDRPQENGRRRRRGNRPLRTAESARGVREGGHADCAKAAGAAPQLFGQGAVGMAALASHFIKPDHR